MKLLSNPLILMSFVLSAFCSVYMAVDVSATPPQTTQTVDVTEGDELIIRIRRVGNPPVVPPVKPPVNPPVTPPAVVKPGSLAVPADGSLAQCLERIAEGGKITIHGRHVLPAGVRVLTPKVQILGGTADAELTVDPATFADGAMVRVEKPGVQIAKLKFDGRHVPMTRLVRGLAQATNLVVVDCELANAGLHAIDFDGDDTTIQRCRIHHALRWQGGHQDAHGIVCTHANGVLIEDCDVWNCSGDCWQGEQGRWKNVVIRRLRGWLEPLEADMAGYRKGDRVGENVIDTKSQASVNTLVLEDIEARGYRQTVIGFPAAFNIKQSVLCRATRCSATDCFVGWRLRQSHEGKRIECHMTDCSATDCDVAVRIENQSASFPTRIYVSGGVFAAPMHVWFDGTDSKKFAGLGMPLQDPEREDAPNPYFRRCVFRGPFLTRGGDAAKVREWFLAEGNQLDVE